MKFQTAVSQLAKQLLKKNALSQSVCLFFFLNRFSFASPWTLSFREAEHAQWCESYETRAVVAKDC